MRSLSCFTKLLAIAVAFGWMAPASPAAIVSFDLSFEYSGGQPPAGPAPWLRATFDDSGTPGSVMLSLTTPNLSGVEFVNDWYFNLDPALNPNDLNFTVLSRTGDFATPAVGLGTNAFKAGGNTLFDILIDFANAPPGNRFRAGHAISFEITGIPTLSANSFDFLSVPGGHGPFPTVAKVQAISPNDGSGWVTIPEPTSLGILAGAVVLLMRRRRQS